MLSSSIRLDRNEKVLLVPVNLVKEIESGWNAKEFSDPFRKIF